MVVVLFIDNKLKYYIDIFKLNKTPVSNDECEIYLNTINDDKLGKLAELKKNIIILNNYDFIKIFIVN